MIYTWTCKHFPLKDNKINNKNPVHIIQTKIQSKYYSNSCTIW